MSLILRDMGHGVGSNRGGLNVTAMEINYYLTEPGTATQQPVKVTQQQLRQTNSIKFRVKSEQARQRTSSNRIHALHLSAYPHAVNEPVVLPPATQFQTSSNMERRRPWVSPRSPRSSPRREASSGGGSSLPYPVLRSTNHVFNDVVLEAKATLLSDRGPTLQQQLETKDEAGLAQLPAHLRYAATYSRDWSEEERLLVRTARKMPYDSTIPAALGRPTTIYRDDFCRSASKSPRSVAAAPSEFRDQILPAAERMIGLSSEAAPEALSTPRRPHTARILGHAARSVEPAAPSVAVVDVTVGTNVDDGVVPKSWISDVRSLSPTRRLTHSVSPRRRECHSAAVRSSKHDAGSTTAVVSGPIPCPPPRDPLGVRPGMASTCRSAATASALIAATIRHSPSEDGFSDASQSYFTNRARYTVT